MISAACENVYQQTETVYTENNLFNKFKFKNPIKIPKALLPPDRTVS